MVVKRAHTNANIAPAIRKLRGQINAEFPDRDKSSDGIWPSAAHSKANPTSDHEAGNALDIDNDLGRGVDVRSIAYSLALSRDPRIAYIIHEGNIWSHAKGWRAYRGTNPHDSHMHISVLESRRRDVGEWRITPKKLDYRCTKTHGAHILPTWLSPTRGKWEAGHKYRCLVHRGQWMKLRTATGKAMWGFGPHFK
jgi:hypothetical protein